MLTSLEVDPPGGRVRFVLAVREWVGGLAKAGSVTYAIVMKSEKTSGRLFVAILFVDSKAENQKEDIFQGRKCEVLSSMIKGNSSHINRKGKGDRGRKMNTSMPDTG